MAILNSLTESSVNYLSKDIIFLGYDGRYM